jgi:hypothetical protein
MTAGTIVDGLVAGNALNLGTAALHGKLAGVGRAGGASVIGSASKTAGDPDSPTGIASPLWRAVPSSESNAAELHVSWKEEFQDQASRLAEANDASGGSNPTDLDEFILSAPAAASSAAAPGSRASRGGVSTLTASFPVGGQASGRGKAVALQPEIAVRSSGRAGENDSSPSPAFSASQVGASRQSSGSNSTLTSHSSGPSHTPNPHSASLALAVSHAQASATASLPVAPPVSTALAVSASVAGNSETEDSRAWDSRAVSKAGSLARNAVFSADSGPVSRSSMGASDDAIRSKVQQRIGPAGKPLEQASLGQDGGQHGTAAPLFGSASNERILPEGAPLASPGPIAGGRISRSDASIAGAQRTNAHETDSLPLDSWSSGPSAPQNTLGREAASPQAFLPAFALGSSAALPSAPVQPDAHALLQLPGVASVTVAGNPREASVRSASGAPRVPANQDPVLLIDSGSVRAGAVPAAASSVVGASADSAIDSEGVRPPDAEALLAAPSRYSSAVAAAPPSAPGVPGDHAAVLASASSAEHLAGTMPAEFLGRETINAPYASSAAVPAKGRPASFGASIGKRDSGTAQGAPLHASGSAPGIASLSHFAPSEAGVVAAGGIVPAIRQDSGAGSVGTSRNSSGSSEIFDLMDQSPVQAAGRDGRVAAASPATDAARELQVGYQDPMLGYVELRAHSVASGVHASLEAQSAAAGDTLTGHLSALTAWMDERRTPLESLTVSTPGTQPDSGLAQHGRDSAASGHGGTEDGGHGGSFRSDPAPSLRIEPGLAVAQPLAPHQGAGLLIAPALPGGSSFSVMA